MPVPQSAFAAQSPRLLLPCLAFTQGSRHLAQQNHLSRSYRPVSATTCETNFAALLSRLSSRLSETPNFQRSTDNGNLKNDISLLLPPTSLPTAILLNHPVRHLPSTASPPAAFNDRLGNRAALDWIIDQYRVKTDPRSAIVNDPNRAGDPHYIARLIAKVITVSPKTPDRPTPPRPGRQTASFSQAKPTTSAGAENCVHQRNQINHSSDNRPLQFIVQTTVTGPKS